MAVIATALVGTAVAAMPAIQERLSNSDATQQIEIGSDGSALPSATGLGAAVSATTLPSTTVPVATVLVTTAPTTAAPPPPVVAQIPSAEASGPIPTAANFDDFNECRREARTVFVSLQAFVYETNAHPNDPDALADIGWLEAHPDGWSSRWAFDYSDAGIAVVPTPGGACDL